MKKITLWSNINRIARNRFVNSAYVFLIVVPILAKLLSKIESPLNLIFGEKTIPLVIELPFSWVTFYFAALLFTIGTILYNLNVPSIIQNEKNANDFISKGKSFSHLESYLDELKEKEIKGSKLVVGGTATIFSNIEVSKRKNVLNNDEKYVRTSFYEVYDFSNTHKKGLRNLIGFLYLIGLIFVSTVFIQNTIYVFKYLMVQWGQI